MFYENIIAKLNSAGIRYAIVGGIAANLHGYIRMTADLDIILLMEEKNISMAINLLKESGFTCKIPEDPIGLADKQTRDDWITNKNMKAINFYKTPEEIDIVIVSPVEFETAEKMIYSVGGIDYPVISIDDLITMKEVSSRPRDREDIRQLKLLKEIGDENELQEQG